MLVFDGSGKLLKRFASRDFATTRQVTFPRLAVLLFVPMGSAEGRRSRGSRGLPASRNVTGRDACRLPSARGGANRAMSMLPLALVALTAAAPIAGSEWHAVVSFQDGSIEKRVEASPDSLLTPEITSAWVWSAEEPPRRLGPDSDRPDPTATTVEALEVRVLSLPGATEVGPLALLSAPAAMWSEVPEAWLPRFGVAPGESLTLPVVRGQPWRLRLAGVDVGSWWIDVAPEQRRLTIAPLKSSSLKLRVVDTHGDPLPGSRAYAVLRTTIATFLAGQDGAAVLEGLPDSAQISLVVVPPAQAPTVVRGLPSSLPHDAGGSPRRPSLCSLRGPRFGTRGRRPRLPGETGVARGALSRSPVLGQRRRGAMGCRWRGLGLGRSRGSPPRLRSSGTQASARGGYRLHRSWGRFPSADLARGRRRG